MRDHPRMARVGASVHNGYQKVIVTRFWIRKGLAEVVRIEVNLKTRHRG